MTGFDQTSRSGRLVQHTDASGGPSPPNLPAQEGKEAAEPLFIRHCLILIFEIYFKFGGPLAKGGAEGELWHN